jgi:hypothetical protein
MLILDGLDLRTRVVKLRARQVDTCLMCRQRSKQMEMSEMRRVLDQFDYIQFCGVANYSDKAVEVQGVLDAATERLTCEQYNEMRSKKTVEGHLLLDVRPACQFSICSLPNSFSTIQFSSCLFK